MASYATNRIVQFGLLALRTGLIDADQLRTAFCSWARDKARPLAEHFADLGALDRDQLALPEPRAAWPACHRGGTASRTFKVPLARAGSIGPRDIARARCGIPAHRRRARSKPA